MAEVDDFLAHYGVKGMKWGKRKNSDSGGSDRSSARNERKLERAKVNVEKTKAYAEAKTKGIKYESAAIKEARAKISAADAKYSIAKAEARVLRQTEGKAAVKKAIRSARLDRDLEYIRSERQASLKTGTEIVTELLFGIGGMALGGPNPRRN